MKVPWFLQRAVWWAPALLWATLIFFFSHQSELPGAVDGMPDYLLHFGAYAVLATGCALGLVARIPLGLAPGIVLKSWLLASIFGISDELHQAFVPARNPSWTDWLADTAGALCAVLILAALGFKDRRSDE